MIEIKLTAAEASTLLTLISDQEERGEYYGPRAQYYERLALIAGKIRGALK